MADSEFIIDVTPENFAAVILDGSRRMPVLVDFWAPWCEPCKTLLPLLEKLAVEYRGKFLLAKVNVDEQQQIAAQFGVRSVPTVKLVIDGALADEFTGALPESELRAFLDRHMETEADRIIASAHAAYHQGHAAEAEAILREGMTLEPVDFRVHLTLAEVCAMEGRKSEAEQILASLPADVAMEPHAQALRARLAFADYAAGAPAIDVLEQTIAADPKASAARHQLAARLVLSGDMEGALKQLLELLRRDRGYGDDAARKAMLQIFDMLGSDNELAGRYRRQMFTAMH